MSFFDYLRSIAGDRDERTRPNAAVTRARLPVQLLGDVDHPDLRDAVRLIQADARVVDGTEAHPEVIVIAQSRPDVIGRCDVERIRRSAPLAGIVGLMGTWCEGETRTGRPWPGIRRIYWYEFPGWWRRQLMLRASGRCPDWARCGDDSLPSARRKAPVAPRGVIELCSPRRETADVLADLLQSAGYATIWHRVGAASPVARGVVAGIWDGGQLEECEAEDLKSFCHRLNRQQSHVVALLDFPRRDRVDRAIEVGAAAVLGKPWMNESLLLMIDDMVGRAMPLETMRNQQAA